MPFYNYPSGLPPYPADTHVTDRTTNFTHTALLDGVAKDVSNLQHNINTTNLMASGWDTPIGSGWFLNIDTNELFVDTLHVDNFNVHTFDDEEMELISFNQQASSFNMHNSAIREFNVPIQDKFMTEENNFILNSSGFFFNGEVMSGTMAPFRLVSGSPSSFSSLFVRRSMIVSSGNIRLPMARSRFMIERPSSITTTSTITEDNVRFHSFGGHTHKDNPIHARHIVDTDVEYINDFEVLSESADITVISGQIDTDNVIIDASLSTVAQPYEQDGTFGAYYIDDYNVATSGSAAGLDLGTHYVTSFNDKIYATSKHAIDANKVFVYESDDLYRWKAISVSGLYMAAGSGVVCGLEVYDNDLWVLSNHSVSGHNEVALQKLSDADNSTSYYKWSGETVVNHGSGVSAPELSPYAVGMNSTQGKLWVYGYTGQHYASGNMLKWDRTQFTYMGTGFNAGYPNRRSQTPVDNDSTFENANTQFTKPFLLFTTNTLGYNLTEYLDGREPVSGTHYYSEYGSGHFNDLFGNGFNEVTSIIQTRNMYNGTLKGFSTTTQKIAAPNGPIPNMDETRPLLVFGNATMFSRTTYASGVFGGNHPVVINAPIPEISGVLDLTRGSKSIKNDPPYMLSHFDSLIYASGWAPGNGFGVFFSETSMFLYGEDHDHTMNYPVNRSLWSDSVLATPFCMSGYLYYKHDGEDAPTQLQQETMDADGFFIPSGTFPDTDDKPTFYDRTVTDGFWSTKTFDWYYDSGGATYAPASGSYEKTYYYSQTENPIEYKGIIYATSKYDTGFYYIGPGGTEYIDDEIMYSDLIVFCGNLYGVGNEVVWNDADSLYEYTFTLRKFIGRQSVEIEVPAGNDITTKDAKMFIHNKNLYIGLGRSRFLVLRPSHENTAIGGNYVR